MDAIEATRPLLERACERLGRPIIGAARGGASDASHFAATVPMTSTGSVRAAAGLTRRRSSCSGRRSRSGREVALAVALEVLDMNS